MKTVRAVPSPFDVKVAGASAELVDSKESLFGRMPLALGLIALVTFVALFLMTGGVLVPVKAIVVNLLAVVFLAFATSEVTFIKLFGLGLALAVVLDATLIRAALVPAFMRLAGDANWWAPKPLRRLHARFGISEADGGGAPAAGPVAPREKIRA